MLPPLSEEDLSVLVPKPAKEKKSTPKKAKTK